jgi:hypothetical protein
MSIPWMNTLSSRSKLISQSEEDFENGHWLSQAQMEQELRQRLGD